MITRSAVWLLVALSLPALAWAQAAPAPQAPWYVTLMPLFFLFGVMYFLMIRPQIKKQKEHMAFLDQIKRGDEVKTSGGILGRVEGITQDFVTLEIADGVRIKVEKGFVAGPVIRATQKEAGR
jgi:preprotein translocase subunit YajC